MGRTDFIGLDPKIKRLVVLGDIHGEKDRLLACLQSERREDTAFVSVGDNVGYNDGPASSQVWRILRDWRIPSVCGNHEAWIRGRRLWIVAGPSKELLVDDDAYAWIMGLPLRIEMTTPHLQEKRSVVQHAPLDRELQDWLYLHNEIPPESVFRQMPGDILCFGHTHKAAMYSVDEAGDVDMDFLAVRPSGVLSWELDMSQKRYILDAGSIGRPCRKGDRVLDVGTYGVIELSGGAPKMSLTVIQA